MRFVQHRSRRHRHLIPARGTFLDAAPCDLRRDSTLTSRAHVTLWPAAFEQVIQTRLLIGKPRLKFQDCPRKRRFSHRPIPELTVYALNGICRYRHIPFHVVKWATDAVVDMRRAVWNDARKAARLNDARRTRGRPCADAPTPTRHNWKNPENLTEKQTVKLAWIAHTDPTLGRAYYLKEGLRVIFKLPTIKPPKPSTDGSPGPAGAGSPRS